MIGSWRGWYTITQGEFRASNRWLWDLLADQLMLIISIRPLEKKTDEDDGLAYGE